MGIIDKVKGKMGLNGDVDDAPEAREPEEKSPRAARAERYGQPERIQPPADSNVIDFQALTGAGAKDAARRMKVVVVEPASFDDAQSVAVCIKEKKPVLVNFEQTEPNLAKRIIDFISGTTYALGGEIKKVGRNVFFCAPSNVNVSYSDESRSEGGRDLPWNKK